jgi:hypothetical protein
MHPLTPCPLFVGNSTREDHRQYLIGTAVGYTCLAFSLVVYLLEGGFVKSGWIAERTPNAFAGIYLAMLSFFPASLAYARMLAGRSEADVEKPPEPVNSRWLVTTTVLVTLAIGLVVEVSTVGSEAFWYSASRK